MQDDVIGGNTGNNVNFGNLASISNAGLYEIRQILSINGNSTLGYSSGAPTSIVVDAITNTYNTGINSSVQIITFRQMSTGNYSTTTNITALDWDGNVGGVVAFEVPGTFTLNHNISADGNGFRGGSASANFTGSFCQALPYTGSSTNYGAKGEGIYKSTNTNYNYARAKLINGGGGGGDHNGGGGGGGNFSAGGDGGGGWTGGGNCAAGLGYGYGGLSLSTHISGNRIFLGGGGGGGQGNNGVATAGGDGGGIILIKADEVTTSGSCAGRTITANGLDVPLAGNDGSGGGGAAGSIQFFVNSWTINASCDLTIESNGGIGGSVNSGIHGGGGAGAQGTVIFNGLAPTANISTTSINGTPGCNHNSNPCTSIAGSASGTNNSGIITGTGIPLPIQLTYFNAQLISERRVELTWETVAEINNDFFEIQRSIDGVQWETIFNVQGAGNSSFPIKYSIDDNNPHLGLSYFRLGQTDFDGASTFTNPRSIFNTQSLIGVYPNPSIRRVRFTGVDFIADDFEVCDLLGNQITEQLFLLNFDTYSMELDISNLSAGTYILKTANKTQRFTKID